ncbi:NTP transferase domain-containing protein [Shewanella litorisediminis]|uniref:NTP transferase domain-containing protein n=1 Tax=Shewanella litorisediminis TaxID=1173586 RepID=A0ABX7G473_9GAMM|nr:NTP transferase domain-containing protein [Shewanella litorisediminis]MCL2920114.1 NTP transferase domain-containing protein [Shewanella litorisediminis]QRH02104.1 NTP transferase domain-containing protein [Shewanella litorisediminis]
MAELTLVILAAGLGSRFGGDKQLARLGPRGETMLELSIQSAIKAGFTRAVLVIRPELESQLAAQLASQVPADFDLRFCIQALDDLPLPADKLAALVEARTKPWGTAHALYCARHQLKGPFAVITADDFYGDHAFACMAEGLKRGGWLMVAYPLAATLSEHGGVNRGICQVKDGYLARVEEYKEIIASQGGLEGRFQGQLWPLAPDVPVSMTLWGFDDSVVSWLRDALISFLLASPLPGEECYLPDVVQAGIDQGQQVRVETAQGEWLGVTYADDVPRVRSRLMELLSD